MRINVNGTPQELPAPVSVSELLDRLKVPREALAVEVNREIVPRSRHAERMLQDGDAVEIVTFVGGG
jgi:sulfur carrier protein